MRTRRIRAAWASLFLVALLAIAVPLMARFQLTEAVRPVNYIRLIVKTHAIHQAHNREVALTVPSTPSPGANTSSSAPGWAAFIVSVVAALGVGAIASALITARTTRKHDERARANELRDHRRQMREKVSEQSTALRAAVLELTTIRTASQPDDADALTEPVKAVIAAHATFRQSVRDAEIELGTTNQLSRPADEVMRAVTALMASVPSNTTTEELKRLHSDVSKALTRFNTSLSQLVQQRGGSE